MKKAYLWIVDWGKNTTRGYEFRKITADLFFSSKEKFEELFYSNSEEQLVEVLVPEDFNDWDYIPDNY